MKIGFVGLGVMGGPMASNLLAAGHQLTVHNRTRNREESLAKDGALRAASPAEAASDVDVVITMVPDSKDLEEVIGGKEGIATTIRPGSLVIDMSTVDPATARSVAEELAQRDVDFIDAPVSGGSEGAEAGTLSIMAGGSEEAIHAAMPIFEVLGSTITHVGGTGMGQVSKAVNQVIIAGTFMAVAEGLRLAEANGLDGSAALAALSQGAAGSWALSQRGPRMLERTYPLGFKMALHRKDLRIALDLAASADLDLPLAKLVANVEDALIKKGHGEQDVSALYEALWS